MKITLNAPLLGTPDPELSHVTTDVNENDTAFHRTPSRAADPVQLAI